MGSLKVLQKLGVLLAFTLSPLSSAQNHSAPSASKDSLIDRITDTSCLGSLSQSEQIELTEALSKINQDFFKGIKSEAERNQEVDNLRASFSGDKDSSKAASVQIFEMNNLYISSFLSDLTLRELAGGKVTSKEKKVLSGLGIDSPDAYLEENRNRLKSYFQTLSDRGAHYKSGKGWDLSKVQIDPETLKNSPQLFTALSTLVSQTFATEMAREDRRNAVYVGEHVYLPPATGKRFKTAKGRVPVISIDRYRKDIKEDLRQFEKDTAEFLASAREAASYSNLMKGALRGGRGHAGKTAPEIAEEAAYQRMNDTVNRLSRDYGVDREMRSALLETMKHANSLQSAYLDEGVAKLELAKKAAIAAPFVPLAMAAAPLAGGLVSPAIAKVAATSSEALALIPLGFGVGSAAIQTGIDKKYHGGNWYCRFQEEIASQGSGALYLAPMLASIPTAISLLTAAPIAAGAAVGSVPTTAVAVAAAPLVYGALNFATAAAFVVHMGKSGVQGLSACDQTLKKSQALANDGKLSDDQHRALSAEAMKQCAMAGVDLAFALTGGTRITHAGTSAFRAGTDMSGKKISGLDGKRDSNLVPYEALQRSFQQGRELSNSKTQENSSSEKIEINSTTQRAVEHIQRAFQKDGAGQMTREGRPPTEGELVMLSEYLYDLGRHAQSQSTAPQPKIPENLQSVFPANSLRTWSEYVATVSRPRSAELQARHKGKNAAPPPPPAEIMELGRTLGLENGREHVVTVIETSRKLPTEEKIEMIRKLQAAENYERYKADEIRVRLKKVESAAERERLGKELSEHIRRYQNYRAVYAEVIPGYLGPDRFSIGNRRTEAGKEAAATKEVPPLTNE